MKKLLVPLFAFLLMFALSPQVFCAQTNVKSSNDKSLIVYYSLSGNTKKVAHTLQGLVGGDILEIKTLHPYPDDFHAVVEQARKERNSHFLPPIQPLGLNPQDYDRIYLGFPIWGNTLPQAMATFLSQNSLAGKIIIPFCTHDGYGIGRSFEAVKAACPNATVLDGFDMLGSNARNAQKLLSDWLNQLGIGSSARGTNGASDTNKANGANGANGANASAAAENLITIQIGEVVLTGHLNNDPAAQAFIKMLPVTISMGQYGGREFYGALEGTISPSGEGKLRFNNGEITYCPQNNTIAIFYAQTQRPNLTMRVFPIGKVTSDLSVFQNLPQTVPMTFRVKK